MPTDSLDSVARTIRQRLLPYAPPGGGSTLAQLLGTTTAGSGVDGKLFLDQIPDDVAWPVGLMTVRLRPEVGDDGGYSPRGVCELTFRADDREHAPAVSLMGDRAQAAWRHWVDRSDGIIVAQQLEARAQIPMSEPTAREVVIERLLLPFFLVPAFLPDTTDTNTTLSLT